MRDETTSRSYFIAYDIFGYLLPGVLLLGGTSKASDFIYRCLVQGRFDSTLGSYSLLKNATILLGLSYLAGHLVAALSSIVLEKWILLKWLSYPTEWFFAVRDRKAPAGWLQSVLAPGYCRPYSEEYQQVFRERFRRVFGLSTRDSYDVFWLVWSYISLHHPAAFRRATHFLNLYGFSRNMCMVFVLLTIVPWPLLGGWRAFVTPWFWYPVCVTSTWLLFANYTKLLRRNSDEVFRGFVALHGSAETLQGDDSSPTSRTERSHR